MIRMLRAQSLDVKFVFAAERMQLNLTERQSTAAITVGPEAPTISVGDWLQDENEPGKGIIWRVKSVDTDYSTNTRTVQCEHLITALKDRILFGDVQPKDISGNSKATECTARQAVQYILKQQSDWTLGTMNYDKTAPYNFNGDDLLSALETVSSSLLDAWWSYDFSKYPFKLSINPKSTAVACEMRMDRNIKTLKKVVDRTRMFTRFYPIGKNNLKLPGGGYVSKNESLYGVISKIETDGNKDTEEKLRAWAQERLNNHAEPQVTVTVSGLELSEATGEALDKLVLGTVCRVPLPEFSTTITERITKLSWGDKLADPETVTITLANQVEDVATIINNLQKSGGGGGRTQAKNDEEDHAWFVDTTDHVGMVAEAVAGKGAAKDWSRVSRLIADGDGIHGTVVKTEQDIIKAYTRIEQNEKEISLEANRRITATHELNSKITVQAGRITSEVEQRIAGQTALSSTITQLAGQISLVVTDGANPQIKPAEIVAAINNGASTIKLSADHIQLDGTTVANALEGEDVTIGDLNVYGEAYMAELAVDEDFQAGKIYTSDLTIGEHAVSWKSQTVVTSITRSNTRNIVYAVNGNIDNLSTMLGSLVTDESHTTIYYLGR